MPRRVRPDARYARAVIQHFTGLIDNLKQLWSTKLYGFETLLLGCCYIDALAGQFLDTDGSEARFRELLWDYADKQKCDFRKVNLDALRFKLAEYSAVRKNNPRPSDSWSSSQVVLGYLEREVNSRDYNAGDPTDRDPLIEDVLVVLQGMLSAEDKKKHWNAVTERVYEASYAGVLYEKYRSALVHEARVRDHYASPEDTKPFYLAVEGRGIKLIFPVPFLIETLETISHVISERYWVPECV